MAEHVPSKQELLYTSCYCEENIYKLLELYVSASSLPFYTVVFLSNPTSTIPLFSQRLARSPLIPVIWDYHVILLYHPNRTLNDLLAARRPSRAPSPQPPEDDSISQVTTEDGVCVYDLDTTCMPFPAPFSHYYNSTFTLPSTSLFPNPLHREYLRSNLKQPQFQHFFRLVTAEVYLSNFASTRKHMLNAFGEWLQSPPAWEVIKGAAAISDDTFKEYIDFREALLPNLAPFDSISKEYLGVLVNERRFYQIFSIRIEVVATPTTKVEEKEEEEEEET